MQRIGDLEIEHDRRFDRTEFRVERAAWWLMLAFVTAAMLGIFGTGPLNRSQATGGGITVHYSRFERMSSPSTLEVEVAPAIVRDGLMQIWFSRDYAESFEFSSITPPPEFGTSSGDHFVYAFRVKPAEAATIVFQLRVSEGSIGFLTGSLGVVSGGEVRFWQVIWP